MHNSKLLVLLRKIPRRQLNRFGEFVASPYFNKSKDQVSFFAYLKKYAPNFEHKALEKEVIIKSLKVSKKLDEKGLAYLMSQQLSLLEDFLVNEYHQEKGWRSHLALLEQFHQLHLPKHYRSQESKALRMLESDAQRNAKHFQKELLLSGLRNDHADPHSRGVNERLQEAADALDIYYIVEKLRYASEMVNFNNILNTGYRLDNLADVLSWSMLPAFQGIIAIQVYRGILQLLWEESETPEFSEVRILLTENENSFSPPECKQLYTLLLNHCTHQINRYNDQNALKEYLEINKRLLENKLLFENGELPPWRYLNLANVGQKMGQAEWAWDFIHKYKNELPESYAENLFHYAQANYFYQEGDFDQAQSQLLFVDFADDLLLNVTARSLLIRVYFESGQDELLHSYLEATRIFLHRAKRLNAQVRKQMQKFVEVTAKLLRYDRPEREKLLELQSSIPPASEIMHWDWVSEQLKKKLSA